MPFEGGVQIMSEKADTTVTPSGNCKLLRTNFCILFTVCSLPVTRGVLLFSLNNSIAGYLSPLLPTTCRHYPTTPWGQGAFVEILGIKIIMKQKGRHLLLELLGDQDSNVSLQNTKTPYGLTLWEYFQSNLFYLLFWTPSDRQKSHLVFLTGTKYCPTDQQSNHSPEEIFLHCHRQSHCAHDVGKVQSLRGEIS